MKYLKIIFIPFILLVIISLVLYFKLDKNNETNENEDKKEEIKEQLNIKESITLEINSELININDLFDKDIDGDYTIKYYLNDSEVLFEKYDKIGEYDLIITLNDTIYKSKLIINDTIKPELKLKEANINEGESYKIEDFIELCTDNSNEPCILEYKTLENYSKEGNYDITIIAKDGSNNFVEETTKLIINKIKITESSNTNNNLDNPKYLETKSEVSTTTEDFKYGIKIIKTTTTTYDLYSDNSIKNKKTNTKTSYDYSTYNATANDLLTEAISNRSKYSKEVEEVLEYTNSYREELNLSKLVIDEDLTKVAMVRAMEMGYGNTLSHVRPNGDICFSISDELGFGEFWGENLAWGQSNAKGATTWWRNSPGHYMNMVGSYTKLGVGVIKYNGRYLWVQVFA